MSMWLRVTSISDKDKEVKEVLEDDQNPSTPKQEPASPFCLLLKHNQELRLGPKTTLDIPISFAPEEMQKYEAVLKVKLRQESGEPWRYNLKEER